MKNLIRLYFFAVIMSWVINAHADPKDPISCYSKDDGKTFVVIEGKSVSTWSKDSIDQAFKIRQDKRTTMMYVCTQAYAQDRKKHHNKGNL